MHTVYYFKTDKEIILFLLVFTFLFYIILFNFVHTCKGGALKLIFHSLPGTRNIKTAHTCVFFYENTTF